MDAIENHRNGSDKCQPKTLKKVIFSSEEFMIKNKFLQVMVWIMGLLAVCKIDFEREVDLSLDKWHFYRRQTVACVA